MNKIILSFFVFSIGICKASCPESELHKAARDGNIALLKKFLRSESYFFVRDGKGRTPLHVAARFGRQDVLRAFLEVGAPLCLEDNYCQTALHWAARYGHVAVVSLLADRIPLNLKDIYDRTSLYVAVFNQQIKVVKELIRHKADVNISDSYGWSPLHMAVKKDNDTLVQILIAAGANVNTVNKQYLMSPLHLAVNYLNAQIVRTLLDYGADVTAQDVIGRTPLHYTTPFLPRFGLKGGKQYLKRSFTHQTNRLLIIRDLLDRGANMYTKDFEGETSLDVVQEYYKRTCIPLAKEIINVYKLWPCCVGLRAVRQAFCMALHKRVGTRSSLIILPLNIFQQICSYLQPEIVAYDKQLIAYYNCLYKRKQTKTSHWYSFLFRLFIKT